MRTLKQWVPIWVYFVLIVFAVGTVTLRLTIVRASLNKSQIEKMLSNSMHEQDQLNSQLSQLKSPRRLERLAKTKYMLDTPMANQVMELVESHEK
jgi:cell division protein FtsL